MAALCGLAAGQSKVPRPDVQWQTQWRGQRAGETHVRSLSVSNLELGDSSCIKTDYHAQMFLGPPDYFPGYADTPLGWDKAGENSAKEFIDFLRRPDE